MKRILPIISAIICLITAVYTIWYMHFGNPVKNSGALSKIGLEHHSLFVIWGILTYLSLSFALIIAYRRFTKTSAYIPLLCVSGIGMIMTLCFDFVYDDKFSYFMHCVGSLTFSAVSGITVFLLFLLNYKKSLMFKSFTYITGLILAIDLICLLIFKETGLIEALPIIAGYIMLTIVNFRREKIEITK